MDFTISEKMKTILGMIDEFVDKELIPLEPEFLTKAARSLLPIPPVSTWCATLR